MKLRYYFFTLFFFFSCFTNLYAQKTELTITGKVIESKTSAPMEFVTVGVFDKTSKTPITGTTTSADGSFEVKINRAPETFYVEISFISFKSTTIEDFTVEKKRIDLGTISLAEDVQALEEMTITGEKSSTEFKLDKRVFNVGKDLSNTGVSALEVLNNIPSVVVNIEGQISLRGSSGVQILINGKPSVLASEEGNALGTITADMIERVEVITNPSAKYDAEGSAGIINIILKKEEKKGLNGSISINTGIPNNHSVGVSVNKRTEKFNLFSQFGIGRRTRPEDRDVINRDLVNNREIISDGYNERNENFYNLILGTDYHINDYNVITLSGNYALEKEDQNSQTAFTRFDETNTPISIWGRNEETTATNPKWQYELQYKKEFKDNKKRALMMSALGNFFGKDQASVFDNTTTFGETAANDQQTRTDFKEARYTFKLDYTHPLSKQVTLEMGSQYVLNNVTNDFAVDDLVNGEWVNDAGLTNVFDYQQNVLGVYTSGAYEGDKWGVQFGLRMEYTDLTTVLETTNERNNQRFADFFPSFHTSYKVKESFSLQAGYSRRIYRPRLWSLNPFTNIRDNFNIYAGNPDLLPEYTDSFELNSIHSFKDISMNFGIYYRHTTQTIERVTTFEDGVSLSQPINSGTNSMTGVEFNAKYTPTNWFSLNTDFNYNYFQRKGSFEQTSFDFNGGRFTSRVTAKVKLPLDIDLEAAGIYRSRYETIQGETYDNIFMNFGARKKILKGKVVLNLGVRDVFASRVSQTIAEQPDEFFISTRRQRGRFITFGASLGFGKGEAMQFSGGRRR